ncbi:D-alanyl-D-alanine carboxypeptidase family protein [Clostridium chauvoei]|uniref:D-alanyl-D-alanine carboxypeptidase n=2 Tax=Clostridium chauvoei TaxID=46867 RepID=A0ABD4RIH3_9CLOT|nr:D-alanyl-D-alanine carboxypeptidase family protein [Clostridium chauvoei]ATD55443.1 D-alanyl-D-alanine carboxypeptidase [Clostridium chauvoei]ATD56884.1 D-alanyl-D-alanine carboxypeptidase [Clostridium chauvoei]MBX7280658.1 D-alanyl-D-alanine carboxypeptidase [Clostridium chauvoei]MBX7283142.1 D-alanyl-D-alanine carboxypeptidase [Clostridium chauvoei]MBX7285699.1 D-alanyl-D-alanine carboxypeptidase [Clostridium chauvoei]
MKRKSILKSLALALSISLLAPLASRVNAEGTTVSNPEIVGEAAIVMDMDTNEVIYSKNADVKHSLASTTKLLTALLFAENKTKGDSIPFTEAAAKQPDASLNVNFKKMRVGDTLTGEDAMEALLIFSANDAAYMIAESVAGSVDNFANLMNERVAKLGLKDSHFVNPNGLEDTPTSYNYATPYDLAIIAKESFKNDWVRETLKPYNPAAKINITGSTYILESRNKNLGKNGNIGGKTGTETQAGHCFVGFYERNGRNLVTVVLKSEYGADGTAVFKDTEKIADYGYSSEKQVYKKAGDEVGTVDLEYKVFRFFGPKKTITAPVKVSEDVMYYKNDFNDKNSKIEYLNEDKNAWKLTGGKEVALTYSSLGHNEEVKGTVDVSTGELLKANLGFYLAFILIVAIIAILVLIIIRIVNMRKRRSRRRRRY